MDPTSRKIISTLGDFVADLTGALIGQFTQSLLTQMGLEKLVSTDIETKFKAFADGFGQKVEDSAMAVVKNVLLTSLVLSIKQILKL
mgnify:CR=1 FL=1